MQRCAKGPGLPCLHKQLSIWTRKQLLVRLRVHAARQHNDIKIVSFCKRGSDWTGVHRQTKQPLRQASEKHDLSQEQNKADVCTAFTVDSAIRHLKP